MSQGIRFSSLPKVQSDTVFVVCSGESAKGIDLNVLHDHGIVIAVNQAWRGLDRAHLWMTVDVVNTTLPPKDYKVGHMYAVVEQTFATPRNPVPRYRYSPDDRLKYLHMLTRYNCSRPASDVWVEGLSEDTRVLVAHNSGYAAFNAAYLLARRRIIIFGMDGQGNYFYGPQPQRRSFQYGLLPQMMASTVQQTVDKGLEVINASPNSTVDCYPRCSPQDALSKLVS